MSKMAKPSSTPAHSGDAAEIDGLPVQPIQKKDAARQGAAMHTTYRRSSGLQKGPRVSI